jgi:hypothetical protein
MLFLLVLFSVLSTETAQTWLAQKATSYLSDNLGIDATIEGVKVSLTKDIELSNVYLADEHKDTLIFVGNLKFHFNGFNTNKNLLKTSSVKLNNGKLYLRKHPEDDVFNFQNFINKLSSNTSDSASNKNLFQWKSSTVEIDSMKFIKHRLGCDDSCTNIFIDYSKISIKDFHLNGGEVDADIKSFVYTDRYRFNLERFSGKAKFHSNYIEANDFDLKTEETSFTGSTRLDYNSLRTLGYFVDSVNISAEILEATVSSEEFRSWLPAFPDFGTIKASGHVEGVVNDLNGTNLKASMGNTSFEGNCIVKNSTHAKDIYIEATEMKFVGYVRDYQKYIVPLSDYELPDNFKKLEYFKLNGSYVGDLNEITLKGNVRTALGKGAADIELSNVTDPDYLRYTGFIDFKDFKLGQFLELEDLGNISIKGNINGEGTTTETLDFSGDLNIAYLDVYNYHLTNILANGRMNESKFTGDLSVNDKNLQGQFEGLIDFNSAVQLYKFDLDLDRADLYKLGISKDTIAVLTSEFSVNLDFQDINNFKGDLDISDITFSEKDNFFFFDSITVNSLYANQEHSIKLNSQLLDAELNGVFNIVDVIPSLDQVVGSLFKFYTPKAQEELADLDLEYNVQLKNVDLLTLLFVKELSVAPGTKMEGFLKMPSQDFKLDLYSSEIKYAESELNDLSMNVNSVSDTSEIDLIVKHYTNENVVIDSNHIVLHVTNDSVDFKMKSLVRDSIDSYVSIAGHSIHQFEDFYELNLRKSTFNIGLQDFNIVGDNKIEWHKERVTIENIFLQSEKSNLAINGILSENRNEILRFSSDSLNIGILNYFIGDGKTRLSGTMNGDIMIGEVFAQPKIYTSFGADSLLVNEDWVGDVFVESEYNYDLERFEFQSNIKRGKLPAFDLKGFFVPDGEGEINAIANFTRFRVNSLSPLLSGVLEDLKGTITGGINLSGPLAKPHFDGTLTLNQIGMKVPLMQTNYNFIGQHDVKIVDTAFIFPKINFVDSKEGTKGVFYGSINHHGFDDFFFDLKIDAKNLLAMDLEKGVNKYFYGKGYATGMMKIIGPIEEMLLEMTLRTEENTDFKLPISGSMEVERNKFVTFSQPASVYTEFLLEEQEVIDLRGLTVKMNIQVTPNAHAEIIMDETVGDIISGVGKGNLRIEMKPSGEMEMFGEYDLEKGDYLFTMRNIINKPFVLEPGGKLNWKGDPYNAQVDLRAKYSTRTTIDGIVTSAPTGQRVTVDLYLVLKGPLMNPIISFEIELPGSSPAWQEELRNKLTNVDLLNQQAFSLLVLNMFWTDEIQGSAATDGLMANSVQVLSNQFSNWINAGTKDYIDINMNYSTSNSSDSYNELEIGLSKGFYDDRIIVKGILDVPVGGTNDPRNPSSVVSPQFAADVEVLYKITKDGRIRGKVFNRNNQNNPARAQNQDGGNALYTQGVGIQYQKDFDAWGPFLKRFFSFKKEPEPEVELELN